MLVDLDEADEWRPGTACPECGSGRVAYNRPYESFSVDESEGSKVKKETESVYRCGECGHEVIAKEHPKHG